jgi:EmrB/QacA subfamily drug resistance transporter
MLDSSVVNVAVPVIARQLDATLGTAQWTLSAYLLAMAITLPATTYAASRFGVARAYLISLCAFTLTSAACALAPSIGALITLRAAQGASGAALVPLAMAMIYRAPRKGAGSVVGALLFFLAPALGPTIGGLLLQATSWRALFLMNVPIGMVATAIVVRHTAEVAGGSPADPSARLDLRGLAMLAGGLGSLVYATAEAPQVGWLSSGVVWLWPAGAVLLAAYGVHARRCLRPAVRTDLVTRCDTGVPMGLVTVAAVVLFAVLFLIPIFLQEISRESVLTAGLVLLPQGLAMGLSTGFGERATHRLGLRPVIAIGMSILTLSTLSLLTVDATTSPWLVALVLTGRGLALGLVVTPLLDSILLPLPASELADASTTFNIAQRLGGSLGIAAVTSVFASRERIRIAGALRPFRLKTPAGTSTSAFPHLPGPIGDAITKAGTAGFHDTVVVLAGLAAIGLLATPLLRPTSPRREVETTESTHTSDR